MPTGNFSDFIDVKFYRQSNPDLVNLTDAQLLNHFNTVGIDQGRVFSPFIDLKFYQQNNSELAGLKNRQLFEHLVNTGINEGKSFSPYLDLKYYRQNNPDLASSTNKQLWDHFTTIGFAQGRAGSPIAYNSTSGFGLVNAAAAVAEATGQNPFPEVANLGGNSWDLDAIKAPETWSKGYTGQGIVVAVVDSGVDYKHSDLDGNIWVNPREIAGNQKDDDGNGYIDDIRGWDFVTDDNDPMDLDGHGTHVAGTIAAEKNGFGATGVAPNAKIMPIRVLDGSGNGSVMDVAAGIRYAADNGAKVINLSLGGPYGTAAEASAIKYAAEKGAVVVSAAGNERQLQPGYPARYASHFGIAVGAVNRNNQKASFSDLAGTLPLDYVDAPGVSIYSTFLGNSYRNMSGTSMASPHIAGVAALVLSANPNLTPVQVENILTTTANSTVVQSASQVSSSSLSTNSSGVASANVDSLTGEKIDVVTGDFIAENVPATKSIARVDSDLIFRIQGEVDSLVPIQESFRIADLSNELHSLGNSMRVRVQDILCDRGLNTNTNNTWTQITETEQLFT
ncbi:S8 family peptidase [Aerosakkonemataceae cyanobacterium BLCC-F154]|uniref:S8 family peptidase n=1 Tax=Floridaenema fluviatile BLCC-F154 TaxID=3153640 RepID=A0ABV4Y7B7_9CYAN